MLGFGPVGSFPVGGLPDEGAAIAYSLAAETGSFALTGNAATFTVTQASATGLFALTGIPTTFTVGIAAETGSYALTGIDAPLIPAIVAATGEFVLTGYSTGADTPQTADTGSFALTGVDVGFTISLVAEPGSFALTGGDAAYHIGQDQTLTVLMPRKVGGGGQTISRKKIAKFIEDDRDRKRREAERIKANAEREARKEREAKERTARLAAEALRDRIDGIDRNAALNYAAAIQAGSGDVMANTQRLLAMAREAGAAREYAMKQAAIMDQMRDDEDVFSILAA